MLRSPPTQLPATQISAPRVRLLAAALLLAVERLECDGRFAPFGIALDVAGELLFIAPLTATPRPDVHRILHLLSAGLALGSSTGRYAASALVCEADLAVANGDSPGDGVGLEMRAGTVVSRLYFPYQSTRGKVVLEWPALITEMDGANLIDVVDRLM
jgi:hypothetical protein